MHSLGQSGSERGLWGFSVDVQPRIPAVIVLALPPNLHGKCNVAQLLEGNQWDTVRNEILKRSGGRCTVSGARNSSVAERWEFDDERRVLKLIGFAAEAPEITRIANMLESKDLSLGGELQIMNQWCREDAKRYFKYVIKLMQQRGESGDFKLDLGLLSEMGLQVPEELRQFVDE